jgi:aminopeptidase N
MSKRIIDYEDQKKLTELMDKLEGKLNANTKTDALKNIDNNKEWSLTNDFLDIYSFVEGFVKKSEDIESQLRLPRSTVPSRYRIHIDATSIYSGGTDFSGEVEIDTKVEKTTDHIVIHSKRQMIDDLKVFNKADMTEISLLAYNLYPKADTLTIYFEEEIDIGMELEIHIKYHATLLTSANGFGFYQTNYVDSDRVTHFMAATNFESSVSTRYAFPQYDEPGFKAVYELTITHDERHHAISNMMGIRALK